MHLITNDKQVATIAHGDRVSKQQEQLAKYIEEEMSHIVYLEDKLIDPTNSIKQLGRPFTSADFEVRLKKILPSNCIFIDNPTNISKKAIVRILGVNKVETLVPYERGFIPEHSIMQLVEKEVPDPDVIMRRKTIKRNDLPKHEYVRGEGFVFDDTVTRPGFKRIKQVGREITRGWRTVLLRLLMQNVITITDIEKVFGNDDTPAWAQNAGRHEKAQYVPW